ncbi:hypothetical protein EK21DRAFT_64653, partial [Setomelanomma holmii]
PNIAVDYMICTTCSAEAFTWLAETFACQNCGEKEYISISASRRTADDADGKSMQ